MVRMEVTCSILRDLAVTGIGQAANILTLDGEYWVQLAGMAAALLAACEVRFLCSMYVLIQLHVADLLD